MKLSTESIAIELSELDGWEYQGDRMAKTFRFTDFVQTFGFMTRVALCAEHSGHYPVWSNSYDKVDIALTTHTEGGLTRKDFLLSHVRVGLKPSPSGEGFSVLCYTYAKELSQIKA